MQSDALPHSVMPFWAMLAVSVSSDVLFYTLQMLRAARTGLSTINASIAASSSGGYFRPPKECAREVYRASCFEVPDGIIDKASDVVEELAKGVEEWGARVAPHAIPQEYAAVRCPQPTACMQSRTAVSARPPT